MEQLHLREHDLVWREVEDEIVILDMKASVYAGVNASGRVLWLRLAAGATEIDLADELQRVYGLSAEVARADVTTFLAAMRAQDLLT